MVVITYSIVFDINIVVVVVAVIAVVNTASVPVVMVMAKRF